MIKERVTLNDTVNFLNSILKIDQSAITSLFSMRIACNKDIADHPTVQVGCEGNYCQVGMIGILNGLFGKDRYGWGHISADYENGKIVRFRVLTEQDVQKIVAKK
jgi:hypothetical protein